MSFLKTLGGIVKFVAPVATAVLVGPEAGAAVGAASAAAWGAKKQGQGREERTGVRIHKVTAPAAAVVGAVGANALMGNAAGEQICSVAAQLCQAPDLISAVVPAVLALLGYRLGADIQKVEPAGD